MMNPEELLALKIRLLTEGASLPDGFFSGRKGGAGPVGGRYFILPNGRNCGVPIREGKMAKRFESAKIEPMDADGTWLFDSTTNLIEVPKPAFYDLKTEDGIPYNKIALLHGPNCLATTAYQSCRYWNSATQCKYCTIPMSHLSDNTILEKTPAQIAEVVQAAEKEGTIKHILLTTGTPDSVDLGITRLADITRSIRKVSELPVAVQFEPPEDLSHIDLLAEAGVNAVGIHLESADEKVREEFCPGKYKHGSFDAYKAAWERSLEHFKPGDVSTFILLGLGENIPKTLQFCEDAASMGVMPIVTPIRPAAGSQLADYTPSYVGALDETIDFYQSLGDILVASELNPRETAGGCSRCGGCTPIQEAYDWASSN
ncbi:MAG: radical SAM protein [Candidatus Thorarchaeota archaeon]|nr:radical SAM protein [Candidatus Thorarchaeota archaeon]